MINNEMLKSNDYFKNQNLKYAFDSLTKVLNREIILGYIKYLINKKIPFTVGLCDIDNFKTINDTYGHMAGDQVLTKFADVLTDNFNEKGIIGRFGGDEFIIVLEGITEYNDIWEVFHNNNFSLAKTTFDGLDELSVSMTAGISRYPLDGTSYEDILNTADKALYRGKMKGRNCFIIYLAAKHAKIEIHNLNEGSLSSTSQLAKLFDIMSSKENKDCNIQSILEYFSTYFMMDHVVLENKDVIFYVIHPLSKKQEVNYIDIDLYRNLMNSDGLFYMNNRRTLVQTGAIDLHKRLKDEGIVSSVAVDIEYDGRKYGILRIDSCDTNRVWQAHELDLLLTAARLIAISLTYTKVELEDIFKKG